MASTNIAAQRQIRVLQIVENLNNQAVESWLIRVLKRTRMRHPHVEWTFFCTLGQGGSLDEAALQLGARVIHSQHDIARKWSFLSSLRQVLIQNRFDVLHSHHDIMSAIPLFASVRLPIRRIVHVHNTSIGLPTESAFKKAIFRFPFRQICLKADKIVGVSEDALDAMLGGNKRRHHRDTVIHCGIETDRFRCDQNRILALRKSFGFPQDAKILLFVGRMNTYKNPAFVIEVLRCLRKVNPRFAAVFAGTGPLEDEIRGLALQSGLQGSVNVLGWRQDIPELMHACDMLIWPGIENPKEGLGLGIVEAQAAGLPVLMSRNVPLEAIVIPELVRIVPLSDGPKAWADAVFLQLSCMQPPKKESLARVANSTFSIEKSSDNIASLYMSII